MKSFEIRQRVVTVAISVVILLVWGLSCAAQGIVKRVTTSKKEYTVGEPVIVQVSLSNETTTVQNTNVGLTIGWGYARYYISTDAKLFEVIQSGVALDAAGIPGELAPGQSFHHDQGLFIDLTRRGLLFPTPNDYYIRVIFGQEKPEPGHTVHIRVVAAATPADINAFAEVNEIDVISSFSGLPNVPPSYGLPDPNNQTLKKLRHLAEGESVYSPYAAYLVSLYEADPNASMALLNRADRAGFPLRSQVVFRKGALYMQLRQFQKAVEQYDRIRREYSETAAATQLSALERQTIFKNALNNAKQEDQKNDASIANERRMSQLQGQFGASGERPKVEATVRRFKAAHTAGRMEECEQMMTEDFLRGGSMDRTKSLAKMQKEFDKLQGKRLEAIPTFESVMTDGTNVIVAVDVVYRYEGQERSQKESYTLRQEQGQWKISRFAVTSSERPPDLQTYPPAQQK